MMMAVKGKSILQISSEFCQFEGEPLCEMELDAVGYNLYCFNNNKLG